MKLNRVQLLQRKAWQGVGKLQHDPHQDLALIMAYRNGDEEAGMKLVESYLDVFNHILHNPTKPPRRGRMVRGKLKLTFQDYEDMFQELLYQFFKLVEEFDPSHGVPFEHFVRATLHQRFYNSYFEDLLEDRNKRTNLSSEHENLLKAPEKSILLEEDNPPSKYLDLYKALNKLSKVQRQILTMNIIQGYSLADIARELNLDKTFVRVNKHRALKQLRKLLGER